MAIIDSNPELEHLRRVMYYISGLIKGYCQENAYNVDMMMDVIEDVCDEYMLMKTETNNDNDIDTVVEIDHEEKAESEFTLDVNTAIFTGTQIKDMYEGTGISFIDYHYLYLIGDTAREMERQLDKMEYTETTKPDVADSLSESVIKSTESTEPTDSSNTIINGIEVSKEEEQSLLGGEF